MQAIYEYRKINVSLEPSPDPHGLLKATIASAANRWAEQGWRTVSVIPSTGVGYADAILIERKIEKDPIAIEVEHVGIMYRFPWKDVRLIFSVESKR